MFASGMDSAREAGEVGRVMQIPMQFMWPHGGRSVHLAGTFTRWTLVQMSQLEGCANVFQTVWSVTPGYHQYKFLVDGVWRHDEGLHYMNSEHGIVNTLLLTTEPAYVQPSPEMPSGTVMDVDNDAHRQRVRVSEVASNLVIPRISEDDLRVSHQCISLFLSTHTAYDLLPDSGKVVVLDVDLPVKQAFHILHEQGIPMAPLWDSCKGQFAGVLSAMDFILILRELGNHGSDLTEEQLETHTISAWKDEKAHMNRKVDGHGGPLSRQLIQAGPYDKLKDVALKVLENEVSTVPIIHSSSEDGSFPQLLHLATLSGILKCICRYFRHCSSSLPALQLPICAIPVGTWVPRIGETSRKPLVMLRQNVSLSSALNLLLQAEVSSIPIVDDNDALLDIYCRSDITTLAKDRTYTNINLNATNLKQALQLGLDAHTAPESRSQRLQMCLRTDSLHRVMEKLSTPGVRRVVVVEAGSKRVEGIISLTDIFRFLLG